MVCMETVLASALSDTRVMSTDGQELGTLHNATFDTADGRLQQVVIETDAQEVFGREQDEDGYVRLPAELIKSMRDHLIFRPSEDYV